MGSVECSQWLLFIRAGLEFIIEEEKGGEEEGEGGEEKERGDEEGWLAIPSFVLRMFVGLTPSKDLFSGQTIHL